MVNPFLCGSGSFSRQLEKEEEDETGRCSTPRKLTQKKSKKGSLLKSRDEKNPYANRGLDKFSALLAEVEDKKQKIYTQIPSNDISLLRFTYSDKDHIKPIVVKVRDNKQYNEIKKSENEETKTIVKSATSTKQAKQGTQHTLEKSFSFQTRKTDLWKPRFYLPAVLILILVFLAFVGRSFSILCTCILWYLIPIINERSFNSKREKKKKEYTRRASDKTITVGLTSPKSVLNGFPVDDMLLSPHRKGCYRKSW